MRYPAHPAADLFPLMQDEEIADLAADIRANGLREPVWLHRDGDVVTVLDGRNRLRACEDAGVEPDTRFYGGPDPIGFSVSQNLKRRHLTTGQRAAVAVSALPLYEAEALARMTAGTAPDPVADLRQGSEPRSGKSTEQAAKTAGTSGRAVSQFKRVAKEAPDLADKVRDGSMALDRAERVVRDRQAQEKRIEKAKEDAANTPVRATVDIRHGDFRDVLADLTGIDAIITDPPYPREFLPLLEDLAAWADKALAPDGVMAVLIGQTHLPEVYRLLDGHRPYRWTGCYSTPGSGYVSHPRRVQSNWKPVIVYGGGPRFADTLRTEGSDADAKEHHRWGQDYSAFHTLIERLTSPGQTVVDPFMGSGTTLLAAHAQGRHTIGCDVDPAAVNTARERLS